MNKKILILILLIALTVSLGCTQGTSQDNTKAKKLSAETIQEILEKGKSIDNIQYDVIMTTPFPLTLTVYQKKEKYKMETSILGQKSELIFNGTHMYNYDPAKDVYLEMDVPDSGNAGGLDFLDFSEQALNDIEMKELGEETVNDMKTKVIEFKYKASNEDTAVKTKAWISIKYGIPVKLLMTTEVGKAEMSLKNIKLNSVEDAVFVVPQDKIKTMEELMQEYNFDFNSDDLNYN